jgi:hypothetical protein
MKTAYKSLKEINEAELEFINESPKVNSLLKDASKQADLLSYTLNRLWREVEDIDDGNIDKQVQQWNTEVKNVAIGLGNAVKNIVKT